MGNCLHSDGEYKIKKSDYHTVSRRPRRRFWGGGGDHGDDNGEAETVKRGEIFGPDTGGGDVAARSVAPPPPMGFSDDFTTSSATATSSQPESGGGASGGGESQQQNQSNSSSFRRSAAAGRRPGSASSFSHQSSSANFEGNRSMPFYTPHLHGTGNDSEGNWSVHKARMRNLLQNQQQNDGGGALLMSQSSSSPAAASSSVFHSDGSFSGRVASADLNSTASFASRSLDFSYLVNNNNNNSSGGSASALDRDDYSVLLEKLQQHEQAVRVRTETREEMGRAGIVPSIAVQQRGDSFAHRAESSSSSSRRRNHGLNSSSSSVNGSIPPLTRRNVKKYGGSDAARTGDAPCWVIIRGHVYAVDVWIGDNGDDRTKKFPRCVEALLRCAGDDCTEEFESVHGPNSAAVEMLKPLCLGPVVYGM